MRNRAERLTHRLEDLQTLLQMYSEPPLDQVVDSPDVAGLIQRLKYEEARLICRISHLDG